MCHPAQMTDVEDITNFIMAGNSTFTLVSIKTGNRITYKARRIQTSEKYQNNTKIGWWISSLTGADNEADYSYLGTLWRDGFQFVETRKSPAHHLPFMVFEWFIKELATHTTLPKTVEFWHEGKCAACGRKLTTPDSIQRGMGPVCYAKTVGG